MKRRRVLLSTSLMYKETPSYPGQEPVARAQHRRTVIPIYSTGKLEEALEKEMEVFVVSILPAFQPHDLWWIRQVRAENIYHASWPGKEEKVRVKHFLLRLNDAWKPVYERLGLEWTPDEFERFDDPGIRLVTHHGFIDGSTLKGFGGSFGDPYRRLRVVFKRLPLDNEGRKLVAQAIPQITPEKAEEIARNLEGAVEDLEETERLLQEILHNFRLVTSK